MPESESPENPEQEPEEGMEKTRLPIIKRGLVESMQADSSQNPDILHVFGGRLEDYNPELMHAITELANDTFEEPQDQDKAITMMVILCKILNDQAEADSMDKDLK